MPQSTVKVVLITNAGQGYGRSVALAYGDAGYDVVCVDKDVDLASKTAAEIEELGGQAIPIQADMTVSSDVRKTFDKVLEIFGVLSGVVHLATFQNLSRFIDLSDGEFAELNDETFKSSFWVMKNVEKLLASAWVVIVTPPASARAPHMRAVRGAIKELARGFMGDIRVNVITPSRPASDPGHDSLLVNNVRYLGSSYNGLSGHALEVKLPPPPRVIESLLPEVQAALDDKVRQDDLEASLYDELEAPADDVDGDLDEFEDALEDETDDLEVSDEALEDGLLGDEDLEVAIEPLGDLEADDDFDNLLEATNLNPDPDTDLVSGGDTQSNDVQDTFHDAQALINVNTLTPSQDEEEDLWLEENYDLSLVEDVVRFNRLEPQETQEQLAFQEDSS